MLLLLACLKPLARRNHTSPLLPLLLFLHVRYLLIHATDDIPAGAELTSNKIGRDIISPLASRQRAVKAMTGRPCGCKRCRAEAELPQEVEQQLQELYENCGGRWAAAMQEGIMNQDTEALGELQVGRRGRGDARQAGRQGGGRGREAVPGGGERCRGGGGAGGGGAVQGVCVPGGGGGGGCQEGV